MPLIEPHLSSGNSNKFAGLKFYPLVKGYIISDRLTASGPLKNIGGKRDNVFKSLLPEIS